MNIHCGQINCGMTNAGCINPDCPLQPRKTPGVIMPMMPAPIMGRVSPEQIEAAAKAAYKAALDCWNPFGKRWEELGDDTGVTQEYWRIIARAAITKATELPKP